MMITIALVTTMTMITFHDSEDDSDLARLLVLASLPARRGVFGVEALVRPTPCI